MSAIPILAVWLNDSCISSFSRDEIPVEKRFSVELTTPASALNFIDSNNLKISFDLSSLNLDHVRFIHFSVRISQHFAVQPDALLSQTASVAPDAFSKGEVNAIRFQPFFLPEFPGAPPVLKGCGLLKRGLHYSGWITPGNVSLMCICDDCKRTFRVQSYHAGFSNLAYFYCSNGPHLLTLSDRIEGAPPLLAKPDLAALQKLEGQLPACTVCGGNFRYLNSFRCPYCSAAYISFAEGRESEYYCNTIYGQTPQHWENEMSGPLP